MVDFGHTPEKLLGRNDSKNPATTCRGITSSGRPCRRALALPGVARAEEEAQDADVRSYCWQHKDQAEQLVEEKEQTTGKRREGRTAGLPSLQEKSSIDTLVQRLGIRETTRKKCRGHGHLNGKSNQDAVFGAKSEYAVPSRRLIARQSDACFLPSEVHCRERPIPEPLKPGPRPRPKKQSFWSSLCCITEQNDDEYLEVVRHRRRVEQQQRSPQTAPARPPAARHYSEEPPNTRPMPTQRPSSSSPPMRPPKRSFSDPQTTQLLSLIPQHLPPTTSAVLMAELVKPISPHDEDGYIYIFWLTPQQKGVPPAATAQSLLTPPRTHPQLERRISDVLTEFSFDGSGPDHDRARSSDDHHGRGNNTVMLKIGRANNVTRRMNEWQRQCGYALNLVRWYPYLPSSPPDTTPTTARHRQHSSPLSPSCKTPEARSSTDLVRKVPYVKKVERLIHLELAEKQVKRECSVCERTHREWFEVEASSAGVRAVDECVRRWVAWAEQHSGLSSR